MKTALMSVTLKNGLAEFAKELLRLNFHIMATGRTATYLKEHDISVTDVSDYTGFPEILDGRVKTLHPKIYGGILARPGQDEAVLAQHDIKFIDLVVVNLYQFKESNTIENIDIGGPTLLRAAAKNYEHVTAVVDYKDYPDIIQQLKTSGATSLDYRKKLAFKVFMHTANYDRDIAQFFYGTTELRYGENPHQKAVFYRNGFPELLQGKALSYNNLVDTDAALQCVLEFPQNMPACAIIKHATPCGAALGTNLLEAYQKALLCDPQSAFGGIIAFNTLLDAKTAEFIINKQFVEVILAPEISESAKAILNTKPNCRVFAYGAGNGYVEKTLRSIAGGVLFQDNDTLSAYNLSELKTVTDKKPTEQQYADLLFAQSVVKHVKSNAIVYAKNQQTLGIGAGQTSRVFSAKIAILKSEEAGLSLKGSVMASDAFFPFPDSIEIAAKAGITAIIQPGGSKNDQAIIDAANQLGLSMLFTGIRHFKH
ncbi:MAG TPA: bifunctional phosphoribosylaminoimidazolecarboxamide formyltransferase/IMP cyclohydrolase [Gammaproteobacteria bacterium]|nr:bifunctional phosphoribosylaminoimidazolecarboxamide formyltransferase/IMP cyclohydrolase [Gammaproteobacteria bacterium]